MHVAIRHRHNGTLTMLKSVMYVSCSTGTFGSLLLLRQVSYQCEYITFKSRLFDITLYWLFTCQRLRKMLINTTYKKVFSHCDALWKLNTPGKGPVWL